MCKDNSSDKNIPLNNLASENGEGENEVSFTFFFFSKSIFQFQGKMKYKTVTNIILFNVMF